MTENEMWKRVWPFIKERVVELGMSQVAFYERAELSEGTFTKMRNHGVPIARPENRRRVERALGWEPGSIEEILSGGQPTAEPAVETITVPSYELAAKSGAELPPEDQQIIIDLVHSLRRKNGLE